MDIQRIAPGERSSAAVVFGDFVFLAGQVGAPGESVTEQTRAILVRIDELLEQAGSDRSCILQAIIWLSDIGTFEEMNAVWNAWIVPGCAPARATSEAALAAPEYKVEITVTAARRS
jgi:enamine deaminase RidA (YjgF/YER057c/UK114 family)